MVISVHALDGSKETDYLDAFGAAVRRPLLRADRMRRRAARFEHRIAVRVRKAQRIMAGGMARAEWPPAIGEEIVGNARAVHQSSGAFSEAQIPAAARRSGKHHDLSPIREAAERALRFSLMQTEAELLSGRSPTAPVPGPAPPRAGLP